MERSASEKKTLKITVVQARDLSGDAGKLNSYAEVAVLDIKGKSIGKAKNTKVSKGKAPKWSDQVEFNVPARTFSGLMVRCWDKHTFRRDGFLGQITIKFNVELLESKDAIDEWYDLSKRGKKNDTVSGAIHLKIQYGELKKKDKSVKVPHKGDDEGEPDRPPVSEGHKQLTASKKWDDQNIKLKDSVAVVIGEDSVDYDSDQEDSTYDSIRRGPQVAALEKLNKDQKIALSNRNLEILNNGSGYTHQYVKANVRVTNGKWYFEAQMIGSGQMHVGWATDNYDLAAAGDCWTFDTNSGQILRKGANGAAYGERCTYNDVIGCSLDIQSKTICFYKNGRCLGEAWRDVNFNDGTERMVPILGINRQGKAKANFGPNLNHPMENQGFHMLNCKLSEGELKDLDKLFNKYKGAGITLESSQEDNGDVIQGDGALKFQEDLGVVDEDDPLMLLVAWKLNCEVAWEFSRGEWMDGWMLYGCHTMNQIKDKCAEWKREIGNEEAFKNFYTFVFNYLKPEPQAKILLIDTAETVWDMLIKPRGWGMYDKWITFLKAKNKKAITRDAWQQLLEFIATYPQNLDKYDETAAWPLLFDEFVEWIQGGDEAGAGAGDEW